MVKENNRSQVLVMAAVCVALHTTSAITLADNAEGLEEIVVTARKVEERLQDIPLSITALGAEQITRQGVARLEDVAKLVPGLTFDLGAFPNDTRPAIRGMQNDRGRPSVAVLLDGQDIGGENLYVAGGTSSLNVRLLDLERIEVVKGPQSVLYGRSAFSGAVNYVSKRPTMDGWNGRAELELAEGGTQAARASISGPLIDDKLAFRLNASKLERDGYYQNPVTGEDLGAESSHGFAFSLLFKPTDELSVLARFQHADDEFAQLAAAYIGANETRVIPSGTYSPFPGGPTLPCPATPTLADPTVYAACTRMTVTGRLEAAADDIQISGSPFGGNFPGLDQQQDTASVEATWESAFGSYTLLFGYLDNVTHSNIDGDYNNYTVSPFELSFSAIVDEVYANEHTNWELRWSHQVGNVDVIIGAQYFDELSTLNSSSQFWLRSPVSIFSGAPFFFRPAPTQDPPFPGYYSRDTRYLGFFGSAQWQLNDQLRLAVEGRYNDEQLDYYTDGFTRLQVALQQGVPSCPPAAPGLLGPGPSSCGDRAALSESKFTPRISLDYKLTNDMMTYVTYAKGYKPGGYNVNEVTDLSQQGYLSESVDSYEVGVKSSWLSNRLIVNVAAYLNDYTDQQVGIQRVDDATGQTLSAIANAGKVDIKGAELEANWRVTDQLSLTGYYAYTDATYDEFVIGELATSVQRIESGNATGDFSGRAVQRTPKNSANLGIAYRSTFENGMKWFLEGDISYRDDRYLDESNLVTLPSYSLVDLRWGISSESWALTAYMNNVFDDDTIRNGARFVDVGRTEGFGAPGRALLAYLPAPRVFGLRVEYSF